MKRLFIIFIIIAKVYILSGFEVGVLKYGGGDWYSCLGSVKNFIINIKKNNPHLNITISKKNYSPDDRNFFHVPFYIMNGHGKILFTEEQLKFLRMYLNNGGFLFANDDYGMDKHFRVFVKKLFPKEKLREIYPGHKIYKSYYLFKKGLPKIHKHNGGNPRGYAIFKKGRMVLFYTYNTDIIDGWDSAAKHGDSEKKRRLAYRMGFNIIYYSMTR
ncbi:MAG: DUF4159 domain-containing protein [Spirochaetes bacterium]|nr:DUF4159 domain-containing protein [Spirochaetota bacterium]